MKLLKGRCEEYVEIFSHTPFWILVFGTKEVDFFPEWDKETQA